ncbi:hypothetical protein C1645_813623 [Glomus cerebriforme]|uniref:Uncharacterized protein n=1 Tax=Glomus cerebriforme TaxID=658196 RepID=A0A397TII1_9GLOM|nr:hypothetical protein C1645_813623 [Glomus cerebriforme]
MTNEFLTHLIHTFTLGIMLLTFYIINQIVAIGSYVMVHESLDIDVHGRKSISIHNIIDKEKLVISIETGEIKKNSEKAWCKLIGKLYLPKSNDLDVDKWKKGIKLEKWQPRIVMTLVVKEYKN